MDDVPRPSGRDQETGTPGPLPDTIELRSIRKTYTTRSGPIEAISDVSLSVAHGEFLSIVGPSGSGKTTILKMIAGLISPSEGTVTVAGSVVGGPISDVGVMFQSPVLLPWRTVLDNVLLPIEMLKLPKPAFVPRARELLEQVGLQGFEDRRPRELSGGMQQRVAICRALIHDPPILLMDEPFASLDEFTRERLNDHLLELLSTSTKTVVFVTHNVTEAAYLSDRVAVLTGRPARVAQVEQIELPRPRNPDMRYIGELVEHTRRIHELLAL